MKRRFRTMLLLTALLSFTVSSAQAETPSWLRGLWLGKGMLLNPDFAGGGAASLAGYLKATQEMTILFQSDDFTTIPASLLEYFEGDGITSIGGSSPLVDKQSGLRPPYFEDGNVHVADPVANLPFVILSVKNCTVDSLSGNGRFADGHHSPPRRSAKCPQVKIVRLSTDRIAWPTIFGWIVLDRQMQAGRSGIPDHSTK